MLGYTLRNGSGYVVMANGGEGVDFAGPVAHLIQSWLTRGLPLDAQATVPVSDAQLQTYAGFYRSITPANDLLRPYADILGLTRVTAGQGKLRMGGKDLLPTGPHRFRRANRSQASVAFVEHDGQMVLIAATSAHQKVALWYMIGLWLIGVILVLGLLMGIVMLIPWSIGHWRGRLASNGGVLFRLLPLVAIGALAVTLVLPLLAYASSGGTSVQQLAGIGPYSLLILVCSMLYPLLAVTGLVCTVRLRAAPRSIRAYVGLTSLALVSIAAYAATIGWLPLRTWVM